MDTFFQILISGLVVGCIYGLVAIGFTTVYNVTNVVNFAQGESSMLAAFITATMIIYGFSLLLSALCGILLVGVLNIIIERVAIRPVGKNVTKGILITIGVSVVLQGLAVVLWGTNAKALPTFSEQQSFAIGNVVIATQALWVIGTSITLMVGLYFFLTRTYLGRTLRACAMNADTAALMGVPAGMVRGLGFFISGGVGAIAGIIIAPMALMQYDSGAALGIKGFIACIIGGFGNPIGAALGGILLGLLEAFASGYISSGMKNAIAFLMLLVFLFIRPGGILGEFDKVKQ